MSDKYNKEEPSLLQKIQNRTGCLFLVIGVAMLAFVLTDLVGSGSSIFGNNQNNIGKIGDEAISYEEFNGTYETLKNQVIQNNPGINFDETMATQFRQQAWSSLVESKTLKPEYDKLGIDVSAAELEDLTIGQNTHPQIQQSFRDPQTGQFNKDRLIRFLKDDINNDVNAKNSWVSFQKQFTEGLVAQKYNALVASSFYATELEAINKTNEEGKSRNVSLVVLPYSQQKDIEVSVTEADILAYAKAHKGEFKQGPSRNIEYVKINVVPSAKDSAEMMRWAQEEAKNFAESKDDSAFVSLKNSQTPFDPTYRPRGTFSPDIEEVLFNTPVGGIVGPLEKNGVYSIFKVTGVGSDTSGKTIQVAVLDQSIYASTTTDNYYYSLAGEIMTKVNSENSFESVVESLGLPKRVANNISEESRNIEGISNSSKVARWLFAAETDEGDMSDIIDLNGMYVVARVSKINEEGIPSAEDLRGRVETLVRNEKIGEILAAKVKEALASASNAEALASALETTVVPLPAASMNAGLPYIGQDGAISGAIFGTAVGQNSGAVIGKSAVAVVYVNNDNQSETPNLSEIKRQVGMEYSQNAQGLIRQALEAKSEVKDLRYKFFDN